MDGKLLALAREEKARLRRLALDEDDRRRRIAYGRAPALRDIDTALVDLVAAFAAAAVGEGRRPEDILAESMELRAKKAETLVANGWPSDWLDGAWSCPKCRDTGYVDGLPCECLRRLYEKERARALSALLKLGDESFRRFDLTYYDDTPAPGATRSARRQMEKVYQLCRRYAESFGEDSVNLLFRGGTGLGKTYLSACIARVVSEKGFSVVYETAVSALGAFEEQRFRGGGEADGNVRRLLGCDLLILDDLGTEMVTEFTKSALYTLVNTRLMQNKKTIVSTNLTMDDLERIYTPQICSRLRGEYQDVPFVGRDIRLLKKERGL